MQSFGFAVSLVIMPLFISSGSHHSNPTQVRAILLCYILVFDRVDSGVYSLHLCLHWISCFYVQGEEDFNLTNSVSFHNSD